MPEKQIDTDEMDCDQLDGARRRVAQAFPNGTIPPREVANLLLNYIITDIPEADLYDEAATRELYVQNVSDDNAFNSLINGAIGQVKIDSNPDKIAYKLPNGDWVTNDEHYISSDFPWAETLEGELAKQQQQ